jgi:hypothetical protein
MADTDREASMPGQPRHNALYAATTQTPVHCVGASRFPLACGERGKRTALITKSVRGLQVLFFLYVGLAIAGPNEFPSVSRACYKHRVGPLGGQVRVPPGWAVDMIGCLGYVVNNKQRKRLRHWGRQIAIAELSGNELVRIAFTARVGLPSRSAASGTRHFRG